MHITGMTLSGTPPFSQRVDFTFNERVNLFIGPNASGKSAALQQINSQIEHAVPDAWLQEYLEDDNDRELNYVAVSSNWRDTEFGSVIPCLPPPVVYIGSHRPALPLLSLDPDSDVAPPTSAEILSEEFSGDIVRQAIQAVTDKVWEMEPDHPSPYITLKGRAIHNYTHPERRNLSKVREITDDCVRMICTELIRGSSSHNYVPGPDVRGYLQGPRGAAPIKVHLDMGVDTNDIRNYGNLPLHQRPSESAYYTDADSLPIYAGDLSSGTQGILLWVRWLALKLVSHYQFRTDWEEMPAILLIDEIENHLHPTWQRRVIPALLEHFPGLQIFATTHSPFIVAGLKAGQVHLLKRDENGVVTASTNEEDIIGWTADEILQTMMGVDDPTDEATATAARRLRELRDEGPRSTADAEAERQADMQKQRQLVDRDLLAGGPKARRREEFGQRFREALERRRQTEELNQDNG